MFTILPWYKSKRRYISATTYEALTDWNDLIHDMSARWADLMEEAWKDLPPDTARKLLKASKAFADAGENLMQHLGIVPGQEEMSDV